MKSVKAWMEFWKKDGKPVCIDDNYSVSEDSYDPLTDDIQVKPVIISDPVSLSAGELLAVKIELDFPPDENSPHQLFRQTAIRKLMEYAGIKGGQMTRKQLTCKEIIEKYLCDNGFDGLAGYECGCGLDDLMPGECTCNCVPAKYVLCANCKKRDTDDCPYHGTIAEESVKGCYQEAK